ncbi:MAG: hypothetical protein U9Q39_02300 [Pseudomonadota bacterium]|nr:hypothetical protein [Pseudomonadota bacterium]
MPEKKWFFDTVVLSNFLLVDADHILEKRYRGKGFITRAVYDEIISGTAAIPKLVAVEKLLAKKVFKIHSLSAGEHKLFLELVGHLGRGEASSIAAAKIKSAIVVTDDRAARKQCLQMKIPVTGTIGILKASFQSGRISLSEADTVLEQMTAGGFYSPVNSISSIV